MLITIDLEGNKFPPAFGYLEAAAACMEINNENPTWGVVLQFDGTSNFSFSSFNVTHLELEEVVMAKMIPLQGPPQLPAFYFPEHFNDDIIIEENTT